MSYYPWGMYCNPILQEFEEFLLVDLVLRCCGLVTSVTQCQKEPWEVENK